MGTYSHSKLSTFEQCPFKYNLRYIKKIIPEIEKSIEAHLGTAVHETLEWLYLEILQAKETPSLDQLINFYSNRWQDGFSKDIQIVKPNMTEKDYFNLGIKLLVDYYTSHHPFKDGTLEIEKKIKIKIGEHQIIGYIDRLVKNPQTGEIEIHDYKTGNFLPTQQKFDEDRQLALYSLAIKESFGKEQNICLVWHYLAHNKKICSKRTNQELENLKNKTMDLIHKIELTKEFPTNKSQLCDWCEYKNMCPEFSKEN
jgi:putative RecB family exonuclease